MFGDIFEQSFQRFLTRFLKFTTDLFEFERVTQNILHFIGFKQVNQFPLFAVADLKSSVANTRHHGVVLHIENYSGLRQGHIATSIISDQIMDLNQIKLLLAPRLDALAVEQMSKSSTKRYHCDILLAACDNLDLQAG